MLDPRWRKVLRDLWLHRSRSLLVLLAIGVGITGAGAVLDTWALLRVVVDQGYHATLPASATITADSVDDATLARVRAMPGIAAAERRWEIALQALVQGSWRTLRVFIKEDYASSRIGLVTRVAGVFPPGDGAIAVERSSLDLLGAGVGDTLLVRYGDQLPVRLGVTGIARDAGLAPGWMEHAIYTFVNERTERATTRVAPTQLVIRVRDTVLSQAGVRKIAEEVGRLVHAREIDVPVPFRHIHADQMNSLLMTQAGFGVLALLLSAILVVNLVTAMLTGQVREIGIMKTLGASPGDIGRLYLLFAMLLGALAIMLAVPAAAFIGRRYAEFSAGMLNFEVGTTPIPGWAILVQVATGTLLPALAALVPVIRGSRIPVGEALRDSGLVATGSSSLRVAGLARPLLLGLRNAFRRRGRMVLTLLTLAMGGAVYIGALNLRASIRATIDDIFGTVPYDVALRFAQAYPADRIERVIRGVEGVASAQAYDGAAVVRTGVGPLSFMRSAPRVSRPDLPVDRAVVTAASKAPVALGDMRRAVEQRLRDEGLEVSGSGAMAEAKSSIEDHLLMVSEFLMLMSFLMIVVGGLGLASTMSLAVLERTREIGVLRAIGARHGAIHAIIQAEGLMVALMSWVVALPLSFPMSWVLGQTFGAVFFKMPVRFVPDLGALGLWLALVVVISVVACAWPAYRATRVPAARALAWE